MQAVLVVSHGASYVYVCVCHSILVCPEQHTLALQHTCDVCLLCVPPVLCRLSPPCSDQDTPCWNQVPAEIALKIVSKIKVGGGGV